MPAVMTAKPSLTSSLLWMTGSQGLGVVMQIAAQIVLAHLLSLHESGIYAISLSVVGFLSLMQAVGLQAFVVSEKELSPPLLASIFTVNLGMSVLVALALVGIGWAGTRLSGRCGRGACCG
jgi:O-antigen/teichoic acid export membrane protein